jgi:hypothetical protein
MIIKKNKDFTFKPEIIFEKFENNVNENPILSIICLNIMSELLN